MTRTYPRIKTSYPGVYFRNTERTGQVFYIRYRRTGERKVIEDKLSGQGWTPAKANTERTKRMERQRPSNTERRERERLKLENEKQRMTFSRILDEYIASKPQLRSAKAIKYNFFKHSADHIGSKLPEELTHWDVEVIKRKLSKAKAKPKTIFNTVELIKRLANFAFKRGLCANIPFHIELPTVFNKTTEYLNPDEFRRFLEALEKEPENIRNFFGFVIYTGLRRDELQTLRWADVDLSRKMLVIRAENAKSGREETIPLNKNSINILKKQWKIRSQRKADVVRRDLVFFSLNGNVWGKSQSAVTKIYRRIKERANLPDSFRGNHGLRHQFGSLHGNAGTPVLVLQKLMQHKESRTTLRYIEMNDKTLRKSAEQTGQLIQSHLKESVIDVEDRYMESEK